MEVGSEGHAQREHRPVKGEERLIIYKVNTDLWWGGVSVDNIEVPKKVMIEGKEGPVVGMICIHISNDRNKRYKQYKQANKQTSEQT